MEVEKMFNAEMARMSLIARYNRGAATHNYIFGFVRGGMVWAVECRGCADLLPFITCYDKSRDALRYRPNAKQQDCILARAARVEILCTADELETIKADFKNNRGDAFEYMTAVRWGGVQHSKRNEKFTDCGDITINGIEMQVKFGCAKGAATFTDGKTLANMGL